MINEQEIERAVRELGRPTADRLDPERISDAVLARLRATPARRWWAGNELLKIAAVLAVVVSGAVAVYRSTADSPGAELAWSSPVSLQGLSDHDLAEVLDSLSDHGPALTVSPGLDDLSERELDQLLDAMEG